MIRTPLSTKGSQIIDANGTPVLLRGVNWFGLESSIYVPHGLWARNYQEMLAQIKGLGYNVIRIPYSVASIRATAVGGSGSINYNLGSNSTLQNKTPLQILDTIIQEAAHQGLMILLDSHSLNGTNIPELWYGDGFTEADWINTWTMLATRYKDQANVIGADLKNEPHTSATWGTGDLATDWRLAAERAGNAILAANPNWLILVEGTEGNVVGQQLPKYDWWGGNLEGVKNYPVRLNVPHKLVYSPHEYGQGVHDQPWFSEPNFPNNLLARWEIGFNYIATQGIAPIWIGEFGGRLVDSSSKEGIWQRKLVEFIQLHNLSFTYWCWNPNSADTGGILTDDWLTVDTAKQQLLNQLLSGLDSISPTPTPAPTPTPTPTPAPAPTPAPTPAPAPAPTPTPSKNSITFVVASSYDGSTNFCLKILVTNNSNAVSKNWQITFQINQASITNTWNAQFVTKGTLCKVTPDNFFVALQPNQTVEIGYCANKLGANYKPTNITLTEFF